MDNTEPDIMFEPGDKPDDLIIASKEQYKELSISIDDVDGDKPTFEKVSFTEFDIMSKLGSD